MIYNPKKRQNIKKMPIIRKNTSVLSFIIILIVLTIGSIQLIFIPNSNITNIDLETDKNQHYTKLKTPDYTSVSAIYIDDTDSTKCWEMTAATFDWCNGLGTEEYPYIIENVIVNGQNSGNSIYIGYSSVYFIIRNCIIYNSGLYFAGLYLKSVKNARILNNNCSFNGDHGIIFEGGGSNNIISNNTVFNNRRAGIGLGSFYKYCVISENIISDNGQDGIVLRQDCDNNDISGNIIYNSGYSGILLQGGSDNNIVEENKVINTSHQGIWIYGNSNNNVIKNNILSKSQRNGVLIEESQYNTVKNNIIVDSTEGGICFKSWINKDNANNIISKNVIGENLDYGISIDVYSSDNFIYFNEFVSNGINAIDNGNSNKWNRCTIGNYWDDYSGTDLNCDKIGDTPYNISGSKGSQDNFPIYGDFFPPAIIINNPLPNEVFGFDAPEFDITVIDESLNATWYTLDNGLSIYKFSGSPNKINQSAWETKESGIITIRFYANDSLGRLTFADINVIKELPN
ncbi:MAG: nitrous oxide reductase family maturation protein NosD [Candidatus Hermodarchaeota archaeon]